MIAIGLDIQQDLFIVPGNHDGVNDVQEKDTYIKAAKYDPFSNMAQWVVTLLAAFHRYEDFVKTLIPNYPEVHPAGIHSRIWRDKINFIHCNTALGADGTEKINQLLDINTLATTAYRTDIPNIILAHNSFFDLHEKIQFRIPIFYQQFEGRYRIIFQGGTWSLECGKYALASRCDLPGGRQPDLGPSGCAESEYYPQMVFEHSESLGVIPP